jgi:serine/threonine-protein kinase
MSPEHVPGGQPIPASDVFGLGILSFQALTDALPVTFEGDEDAYYRELRESQVQPIRGIRPDVPAPLADIVDRCLQRQAARRYIDAAELLAALPGVRESLGEE